MTKELRHLAPVAARDAFDDIASAIVAVENINGHVADFEEILDLLQERELETSDENVDRVRAAVDRAKGRG